MTMAGLRYLALTIACSGLLAAQTTWTSIRIGTDPPGLAIRVDGVEYSSVVSFFWLAGSTHTLSIVPEKDSAGPGARYAFTGWVDSAGHEYNAGTTLTVRADPSITYYIATFEAEYLLEVSISPCAAPDPANCREPLPGTVYINGSAYWRDLRLWLAAGAEVTAEAVANPGFVFSGWDNRFPNPLYPAQTFKMNAPWKLVPVFTRAHDITIESSPPGLTVLVDGSPVATPASFGWPAGSQHVLAPLSPQTDAAGGHWVFGSWSNGGDAEQVFTVRAVQDPQGMTAQYLRGGVVTILTEPSGLKVNVDGSDSWPSPNFIWGPDSTHLLAAPLEQADKAGRRYVFRGWSDGSPEASRSLTVSQAALDAGFRLVARYELLGRLTVESQPAGLNFTVDGAACVTPCTIDRAAGTRIPILAPASVPWGDDARLDFDGWQDQASRERTWTMTAEARRTVATYQTLYRLRAGSDPAGGALVRLDPASADGFYAVNTQVLATAEARPGYRFRRWGGDLEGTFASGTLTLSGPRVVVALVDRVPYISPAGVVNAAGLTPEPGVAAGSIVSIYGENLAASSQVGPLSPLAQTLAGVTVQAGDRLLALFFVAEQQINALVPSDFKPGEYRLTVRSSGQPDVSATFQVVRNAPGLFANWIDSTAYVAAMHEDGTLVLPASPARAGETITLLGTGFGPYLPSPLDGFAVPSGAVFPLIDAVEVLLDDVSITPLWTRAASGLVGTTAVRFQIPEAVRSPGPARVRVRVNGRESTSVFLPLPR
ncbi:MAG TPA: hypothetical protein VLH09_04095 [Bryobacteraceae bacterium]|nr:hypothetical protein [Bryobacteraceae bacterium]